MFILHPFLPAFDSIMDSLTFVRCFAYQMILCLSPSSLTRPVSFVCRAGCSAPPSRASLADMMNAEVTRRADVLFGGAKVRTQTDDLNKPRPMKSFKELQQEKSGVDQMVERNMAARRNEFENKRKKVRERE